MVNRFFYVNNYYFLSFLSEDFKLPKDKVIFKTNELYFFSVLNYYILFF